MTSCYIGTYNQSNLIAGSHSSGGAGARQDYTSVPFVEIGVYPTRVEECSVLFTWNKTSFVGFRSLGSIRMVLTTTNPQNIKINKEWHYGDENPYSDSMNTYANYDITDDAEEGFLYRTWVETGYYIVFIFQWKSIASPDGGAWFIGTTSKTTSNLINNRAPSLTYDATNRNFTVGVSTTGRRILEFYKTRNSNGNIVPYGYPSSISNEETLNEFYYTTIFNAEEDEGITNPYKAYYEAYVEYITRWKPGTYYITTEFYDDTNKSVIDGAITTVVNLLNDELNQYGVYFRRSNSSALLDFHIVVGSELDLFGIDPAEQGYVYGGKWFTSTDENGYIYYANVLIANDYFQYVPFQYYQVSVLEEMLQCMGAGFDQIEYPFDTVHTDFNYLNKAVSSGNLYIPQKDKDILKLLYSGYVSPLDNYTAVAKKLNIPKGCYMPTTMSTNVIQTVSDSFLDAGCTYQVRAFIVRENGTVTPTSSWISVSVPKPTITPWSWTVSNGSATDTQTQTAYTSITQNGAVNNFSYLVWNDMVDKVQEILDYIGESWDITFATYENTKMTSSDKYLTATRFNSLRFNIGSHYSTGINDKVKNDTVYGSYFVTLANSINNWINNL